MLCYVKMDKLWINETSPFNGSMINMDITIQFNKIKYYFCAATYLSIIAAGYANNKKYGC